jgi:hypothetical protein
MDRVMFKVFRMNQQEEFILYKAELGYSTLTLKNYFEYVLNSICLLQWIIEIVVISETVPVPHPHRYTKGGGGG